MKNKIYSTIRDMHKKIKQTSNDLFDRTLFMFAYKKLSREIRKCFEKFVE